MTFFKPLFLISILSVCSCALATEKPIIFHPDYPTIPIPKSITVDEPGVIKAPIGEVTVQSPIVKVTINDKGPYFFIIDTGFSGTLVSKKVALEADLPIVETITKTSRTPNQVLKSSQDIRHAKKVQIGPVTLFDYGMSTATEQGKEYQILEKTNGRGIDGILGFNAFYGLKLKINYRNETITASKESLKADDAYVVPLSKIASVPIVEATIHFSKLKTKLKQHLQLDTGAANYFFINSCDIPNMEEFTGKEQIIGKDYTGFEHKTYFAQLYGNIQLSKDHIVESPYILYAPSNCDYDRIGLMGRKFFEKHEVTIDVDDRLVRIKPYS